MVPLNQLLWKGFQLIPDLFVNGLEIIYCSPLDHITTKWDVVMTRQHLQTGHRLSQGTSSVTSEMR